MENSTGSITPFITGVLPKEKYSDVNEFARDLASILRIDEDRIVIDLVALESLKGEQGAEGPRGIQGEKGAKGDTGASAGVELVPFVNLLPEGDVFTWPMIPGISIQRAALILTGDNSLVFTGIVNGMGGALVIHNILVGGGGTLALPANSLYQGGTNPVVTPGAGAVDIFEWRYYGDHFYWNVYQNFLP